jgi:hypothetical protein
MNRWGWLGIGAGAVGLGILAAAEREPLKQAAQQAATAVRKGARELMSGIKDQQLEQIARYDLARLVELYRGAVPFGVALAMMEHESNFDPTIYNWYRYKSDSPGADHVLLKNEKGKPTLGSPNGHAGEGGPWADGLCAHDPHACGLYQILDSLRKSYPKVDGKTPTTAELFTPEINVQCALKTRSSEAAKLAGYAGGDPVLLAALIYMAHAEGLGKLTGGKGKPGAFSKLKEQGKAITWENLAALPWGASGWWALGNRLSGIAATAARAAVWESAKAQLLPGGGAVG